MDRQRDRGKTNFDVTHNLDLFALIVTDFDTHD